MTKVSKVELIITKRCNLSCKYCGFRDNTSVNEMNIEQLKQVVDFTSEIGAGILVIYGGEPLLKYNEMLELTKYATKAELPFSYISNSVLLNEKRAKELVNAGLNSWTVSVDILDELSPYNNSLQKRKTSSIRALELMKSLGVEDLSVNTTVSRDNLHEVPSIIRNLTSNGYWFLCDLLHEQRWPRLEFSAKEGTMKSKLFTKEDIPELERVAKEIVSMIEGSDHLDHFLIHPPPFIFEAWYNPKVIPEMNLMCDYPGWLTILPDGYMSACEDYKGSRVSKWYFLDLLDNWDEFVLDFKLDVTETDCRCFFCTHFLSILGLQKGIQKPLRKIFTHNTIWKNLTEGEKKGVRKEWNKLLNRWAR